VSISAAQAGEPAPELPLPLGDPNRHYHGLLTYTIGEILAPTAAGGQSVGPSLTYRQLARRIHDRYSGLGRTYPSPLIEGPDQDRPVLGRGRPNPSRIILKKDREGGWTINAGELQGLRPESVLAVFPAAGSGDGDKVLGHVKVLTEQFGPLNARVKPCGYKEQAERKDLPDGGLCRPVYVDYGELKLTLSVDRADDAGKPVSAADQQRLRHALQQLDQAFKQEGSILVQVVENSSAAQWLLRVQPADSGKVYLVPSAGQGKAGEKRERAQLFGPVPEGEKRVPWLKDRLARIAGAENLKRIATEKIPEEIQPDVEIWRYASKTDRKGQRDQDQGRVDLYEGEIIGFRLSNPRREPIDLTLLFIDGNFGITTMFPTEAGTDNRLNSHESVMTPRFRVTSDTVGPECVLAIAVRGKVQAERADFSFLEQPTIEHARGIGANRGPASVRRDFESPLGRLLQKGRYGFGHTRGLDRLDLDDYGIRLFSWRTLTRPRSAGKE